MSLAKLLQKFDVPPGANVRCFGARVALGGAFIAAGSMALLARFAAVLHGGVEGSSSRLEVLVGVPTLVGFLLIVTGSYRAVTGIAPKNDGRTLAACAARLLFASLVAACAIGVVVALSIAFAR